MLLGYCDKLLIVTILAIMIGLEIEFATVKSLYREGHIVGQYGWVDFDFSSSTLCLFLLGLLGNWQKWLSG